MTNLDYYSDNIHYNGEICNRIVESIHDEAYKLTPETVDAYFDNIKDMILFILGNILGGEEPHIIDTIVERYDFEKPEFGRMLMKYTKTFTAVLMGCVVLAGCGKQNNYDNNGRADIENREEIDNPQGMTIGGEDEDYNLISNQGNEQEQGRLDEERNVGVILDGAPEELTLRTEEIFDGTLDSLCVYYGATEPIKVRSDSDEFKKFCKEFFFDHTEPVEFRRCDNETYSAMCGDYEIYRTEFFNPTDDYGKLYYVIDGLEDGMSLKTEFIYDSTGKYAMIWYDFDDSAKYVLARFIGLQFSEENPYVSPIQDEIDKLGLRSFGDFKGNIWQYVACDSVVRVESDEEEFVQYCEEFFMDCGEKINYELNRDGSKYAAKCGDYILLRTEFFDPIRYGSGLLYEGDTIGDTEPPRSEFFYDCTGKYALVYMGYGCKDDLQNELCIKFLGF